MDLFYYTMDIIISIGIWHKYTGNDFYQKYDVEHITSAVVFIFIFSLFIYGFNKVYDTQIRGNTKVAKAYDKIMATYGVSSSWVLATEKKDCMDVRQKIHLLNERMTAIDTEVENIKKRID